MVDVKTAGHRIEEKYSEQTRLGKQESSKQRIISMHTVSMAQCITHWYFFLSSERKMKGQKTFGVLSLFSNYCTAH